MRSSVTRLIGLREATLLEHPLHKFKVLSRAMERKMLPIKPQKIEHQTLSRRAVTKLKKSIKRRPL
jgi:hypothetical protein